MSITYGENLKLTVFGASHEPEIGMTLEGIPAGEAIDRDALAEFLRRRAPGRNVYSTDRKEPDVPEFRSGLSGDVTDGEPLTAVIRNTDAVSRDYEELKHVPRPGHADYTAAVKYFGKLNMAGGGPFSGRMTAPLCIAGGILKQLLEKRGIFIAVRIASIAGIEDSGEIETALCGRKGPGGDASCDTAMLKALAEKEFPVLSDEQGGKMKEAVLRAREEGDSVGGVVECAVCGLPAGLGGPLFDGMEGRIAKAVFSIPAVKGVEFGAGFATAKMKGSENNDPFTVTDGTVRTLTNHAGGILGGITDGMPIVFRAAFKPTPSIAKEQQSIDLRTMRETRLKITGRHDPCIVPRAVPVVEAAAAIAVYDALLEREKETRSLAQRQDLSEKRRRKERQMSLKEYRDRIAEIDDQLLKLFSERMETAAEIGAWKKENGLPVYVPEIEQEKILKAVEASPEEIREYTPRLFSLLFELSRSYQNRIIGAESELTEKTRYAAGNAEKLFPDREFES